MYPSQPSCRNIQNNEIEYEGVASNKHIGIQQQTIVLQFAWGERYRQYILRSSNIVETSEETFRSKSLLFETHREIDGKNKQYLRGTRRTHECLQLLTRCENNLPPTLRNYM